MVRLCGGAGGGGTAQFKLIVSTSDPNSCLRRTLLNPPVLFSMRATCAISGELKTVSAVTTKEMLILLFALPGDAVKARSNLGFVRDLRSISTLLMALV